MRNFDSEFDKQNSKQPNKIQEYFTKNGIPKFVKITMNDNSIVLGNKVKSQIEGPAVVKYQNGTYYVGNMVNGQRSGNGYRSYADPDVFYVGEYKNDKKNGKGKLWCVKKQKWVFEGLWANDMKNGYGVLTRDTGVYDGNWVNDKMEGKGKMLWSNGDGYDGNFKQDLRNGYGFMTYRNGDTYKGEFLNGQLHGKGVYVWKNGEKYDGNFKGGQMDGQGQIEYSKLNVVAQGLFQGGSDRNMSYGLSQISRA